MEPSDRRSPPMRRALTSLAPVVVLGAASMVLGGCAVPVAAAIGAAEFTTLTSTKKSMVDHVTSSAVGENCSIVAFTETGRYCQAEVTVQRPPVYCYRSLGGVDCYAQPDPSRVGDPGLASPPPIRTTHRDKGWLDQAATPVQITPTE